MIRTYMYFIWLLVMISYLVNKRDLEIISRSLIVKLDFQISMVHMRLKNCGPKSTRYEVITLTSHFGSRDLVTLKLGLGH